MRFTMLKLRSKEFKDDGTKTSKTRKTYNSSQYRRVAKQEMQPLKVFWEKDVFLILNISKLKDSIFHDT